MSYKTCEDALAVVIRMLTNYTSTVSIGDYRVLGKGKMKAVILQPGPFTREMVSANRMRSVWKINAELFVGFTTDVSTVASSIRTERQDIIDKIDKYPTLNSTTGIVLAQIMEGGVPEVWAIGAGKWWKQTLVCTVEERATVNYAE